MLVAQGYDAGAHTGPIGTYSLVPQIVDAAGDVPVLVAGGVATGRHVAAGLAMGAAGFGSAPLGFYQKNIKRICTLLIQRSLKRQEAGILYYPIGVR